MQVANVNRGGVEVSLSPEELLIINNALNEVVNGFEIPEFATRIGANSSDVRRLLAQVNTLLEHPDLSQK